MPGVKNPGAYRARRPHRDFVEASEEALDRAPVEGTPTMEVNSVVVPMGNQALHTDRNRLYRHLRKQVQAQAVPAGSGVSIRSSNSLDSKARCTGRLSSVSEPTDQNTGM